MKSHDAVVVPLAVVRHQHPDAVTLQELPEGTTGFLSKGFLSCGPQGCDGVVVRDPLLDLCLWDAAVGS